MYNVRKIVSLHGQKNLNFMPYMKINFKWVKYKNVKGQLRIITENNITILLEL